MFVTTSGRLAEPATRLFSNLHRLNGFVDAAMGGSADNAFASAWVPACDVSEDKENLRVVLDLPGVRPEDVKISLENRILTIRGEKRQQAEEKGERWHRYERSYGNFERAFTVPSTVDAERIQAVAEHGVLTLTLPKAEQAKPREIPIRIG